MFLKSLTLKGFKSFADRTHMVFDPGLTVVVGPNGSGKSNVSDAILWVLGEQSAKMLRGQAMEDVVFSGSSARKPVGVAEVTLVLDNTDHTLPVDFSEVGITRRMYRSGESEYLINGAPARLMDIQDILHDSGLGKDTHSIISQGKLDSILSSRPEERRVLIEEAAGISKHRRRKERSQRKLADMDKNLVRARDVARELNRQLRPLERQVDRAKRWEELDRRLSELTCQLAVDDVRRLQRQWTELESRAKEASAAVELAQFRADEKSRELEKLQSLLEQKGLFVGDLGEQRRRCSDILGRLESDMRLLEEKGRNMVDRLSETRMTLSQIDRQKSEASSELEDVSGRLSDTRVATETLEAEVKRLEPAAREATSARREAGSAQARLNDEQRSCQRELDDATLAHAKLTDEISNAEVEDQMFASRLAQIDEQLETAEAALASRSGRLEELASSIEDARAAAEAAKEEISRLAAERDTAREAAKATREALGAAKAALSGAQAKLEALRSIDAGLVPGSESLEGRVLSDGTLAGLVRYRLADVVSAPAELDSLVERLLGETLSAPVVSAGADVARLMDAAAGEASAAGSLTVLNLSETAPVAPQGEGRRLVDLLDVADDARGLVERLLGDVFIVDSPESAVRAHAANPGLTYVTESGVVATSDGRTRAGVSAGAVAGTLERRREVAALEEGMPALEAAVASADSTLANASAAADALTRARDASADAAGELSRLTGERDSLNSEIGRLQSQVSSAHDERTQVEARREKARERTREARPRLDELKAQADAAKECLAKLSRDLEEANTRRREASRAEDEATKKAADARLKLATSRERLHHLDERQRELSGRISSLDERARAAEEATRSLEVLRLRVDPLHERYEAIHEACKTWAERLRDRASLAEADSDSLKKTIGDAKQQVADANAALEQAKGAQNDVKVESGRLEVRVEQAIAQITADGRHVLEEALQMPEPDDREATEREVASLRRQIDSLGPVNQVAMDEYTKLKERADYIGAQLEDLERARAALVKITAAIDRKMRRQFLETFEAVNANFIEIFGMLFPGGKAHLEMCGPDHPAETGIEVVAQPKGKRIAKMTLMSGGEKSLTALALLFAVYRTRTVPFYVFDEVEAALDDANLDKLLDAIEQLKETTQLIVISHQRRTMEQADVLYGVSMQADGVSHVVSQRLDRATGKVVDA
ncbi:MAG: chromosome segregation protein SMC [Coriobacteriaceae bacterium]|nr:chromosome segregation protein SMC [Coriobacteriaceae bacterium]